MEFAPIFYLLLTVGIFVTIRRLQVIAFRKNQPRIHRKTYQRR